MKLWILDDEHELKLHRQIDMEVHTVGDLEKLQSQTREAAADPAWLDSFATHHRIDFDQIGHVAISTVFIGVGELPFETMVFGPGEDDETENLEEFKYATWREAIDGHDSLVAKYQRIRA